MPADQEYLRQLQQMVEEKKLNDRIAFVGPVANRGIVPLLHSANLFVNMSHTGSLDKAILEAMACGVPVLTCNEALIDVLRRYREQLMYPKKDFQALAEKMMSIMNLDISSRRELGLQLRSIVAEDHALERLIRDISAELTKS